MNLRPPSRRSGFALPMTILAVVGLFILLIGLIAMLSLERRTARSYSDAARADMALQSGLAEALSSLSEVANRDDSLVFRLEDPVTPTSTINNITREQFFTYGAVFNTTSSRWRQIPLFSGQAESESTASTSPDTSALRSILDAYSKDTATRTLGRLAERDTNIPRAKWVELPQATGEYKIRYAWWVEDLNGRIDGRIAGSEPRTTGRSTAELGIYTLFNPNSTSAVAGPQDRLVQKRNSLRTAASTRTVLNEADSRVIEPYLTYSPPATGNPVPPVPLIPHGFGYADAGKPAMNLNAAVAARDVEGIAAHITRNIPTFNNRRGGFPAGEDYVKTLAASIIDYADTDQNATVGPGYRGVDSYPFVNELFDRYEWTGTSGGNVQIRVTTFGELWNPTQLTISGQIEFTNENRHRISVPPSGAQEFTPVTYSPVTVTIPPNGFRVLQLGESTYQLPAGNFPPSQLLFSGSTTTSNFKLRWNGTIVDMARGGLQRTDGTLGAGASNRKWKGNSSPALDISIGQSGDPRSSYYINTWVFANNYDANTSWGGRSLKRGIANANYNEVKITNFADRGSDSTAGTNANSDATLPTSLPYPANQPNLAPSFISNTGSFTNIGELGHIYDPSQWTNVNSPSSAGNSTAGGGYTLAIGRPEFGRFDSQGLRAAQLADLFYIPLPTPTTSTTTDTNPRRININTAPREVLRTLVAGITLNEDPAQAAFVPPQRNIVGDIFADCVINTRNVAPLRSLSDLTLIRQDPTLNRNYTTPNAASEPFFGGRSLYTTNRPPDSWDDAGREELFRKVNNLVTFQGKSFRIVVSGEALDRSGNLLGRTNREIHVLFEPERDATGTLIPNGRTSIRKLYEKSL